MRNLIWELIENWTQVLVLLFGMCYGFRLWRRTGEREYVLISLAMTGYFLGDLTYSVYLWVTGNYPFDFSAADLSYISAYFFFAAEDLYRRGRWKKEKREAAKACRKPAFAAVGTELGLNVLMIWEMSRYGYSVVNILIYLLPFTFLVYQATWMFCADRTARPYHFLVLLIWISELAMYVFSSFGIDPGYYAFDWFCTVLFLFLLPAAGKGVGKE